MHPIFRVFLFALALAAMPARAADPPPLSAYGDLPGVEEMAISPGGTKIAAISRVRQERRLLLFEKGVLASSVAVADLVAPLGRSLAQRTTLYGRVVEQVP